jgi:uncharacterized repeat protein (TIGR03803 family)
VAWFRQLSNPSPEGGPKVSLPCRAKRLGWLVLGRSMVNSAQQRSRIWRAAPALIFFLASIVVPTQAQAQTFKVLHTFHGKDGDAPVGQLVRDKAGNFYGTTTAGGTGKCQIGCGTAFKMNEAGKIIWTHSFNGANGWQPLAGLLRDAGGNLFGTTGLGGDLKCIPPYGCGTVFKLDNVGKKETVLHRFTDRPDGEGPEPLLVQDPGGNLYGTTWSGGENEAGTVFKINTAGKETILYSFTGGSDGCGPYPGVILDSAGNLYGTTLIGGAGFGNSGYGVVFKVDASGNETVLHTFGGSDGANPDSVLLFAPEGNLYGMTQNGGSSEVCDGGCGTVFELSPQNGGWSETVLYSFCSLSDCADGLQPVRGPLVRDAAGNLYGTTDDGGNYRYCNGDGCGVVFKLDPAGKETVLHNFTGGADGSGPFAGLTIDSVGILYGAAISGGDLKCLDNKNGYGCGVVFKIIP